MSQFLLQNALLIVIALIAAGSLAMPYLNKKRFGPMIPPAKAVELINKQNALIIDVRGPTDFKKGRIARSLNIPATTIQGRLNEVPKAMPILLVDDTGGVSSMVSKLLRGMGYEQVYVLEGGLEEWVRGKFPLES